MEAKQVGQNRVEIDIDRELEARIRKRLPQTQGLSQLIERLLQEWLEGVKAKDDPSPDQLGPKSDSSEEDLVDVG